MRFENLQDDFSKAIGLIGTEQKRPLPRINWTGEKKDDYLSCYTPEIIEQVKRVFGPCMKRWGYDFPPEWGDNSISWLSQIEFHTALIVKSLYWNYLRKSPRLYGRLIRQVR